MNHSRILIVTFLCFLLCSFISCSSSSDDSSDNGGGDSDVPETGSACGAIADGKYKNPVEESDGAVVNLVSVAGSNVLIIEDQFGDRAVTRVHGLTDGPANRTLAAQGFIQSFGATGLLFVPAGCDENVVGGVAKVGSFFNRDRQSLAEALVGGDLVAPATNDSCNGARIGQCLDSLKGQNTITQGELVSFLWKPNSDSDGNLAIHVGPFGATVIVNGETGRMQGAGNGFGSLARFNKPGCEYANPQIQVLSSTGFPYSVGGKATFTVPNPCGRNCIQNASGQVAACPK